MIDKNFLKHCLRVTTLEGGADEVDSEGIGVELGGADEVGSKGIGVELGGADEVDSEGIGVELGGADGCRRIGISEMSHSGRTPRDACSSSSGASLPVNVTASFFTPSSFLFI